MSKPIFSSSGDVRMSRNSMGLLALLMVAACFVCYKNVGNRRSRVKGREPKAVALCATSSDNR